jgi:hypothetical protein
MRDHFEKVAASDGEYFGMAANEADKIFDEISLLHNVLRLLEQYASHESKQNAEEICDNTLVGLLELTTSLLEGAHLKKLQAF